MRKYKVGIVVGSLRKESFNRKIARAMESVAPASLSFTYPAIGELDLYNQDFDENPPESWTKFRKVISDCDAVLFVSPEYNRSVPGVLKNAIDVGSRPYGKSVWNEKPAAVVSVSPGAAGGFGANHHLRQSLMFLNMPAMQQPEAYLGGVTELLGEDGSVKKEETQAFLRKFMAAFADWVEHHAKP